MIVKYFNASGDYIANYDLLAGPIDTLDVLYLTANRLTEFPFPDDTATLQLREIWLDSNLIDNVVFDEDKSILANLEYLTLR